jgi:hypothetical protein
MVIVHLYNSKSLQPTRLVLIMGPQVHGGLDFASTPDNRTFLYEPYDPNVFLFSDAVQYLP